MNRFLLITCLVFYLGFTTVHADAQQQELISADAMQYSDGQWSEAKLEIPGDSGLTVVVFLGTECPLAKLYSSRIVQLAKAFRDQDVHFVAINSNQQDSKKEWLEFAKSNQFGFPIIKDRDNVIADLMDIERTPEVIVLDENRNIKYRGRIDDQYSPGVSRSSVKREDLKIAIQELLAGKPVSVAVTQPEGCLIGRVRKVSEKPEVTFASHIAALFQTHCVECHRDGDIGPFVLDDYDEIVGWGHMIVETIDNGRMPPWHADPQHGKFKNSRGLSEAEKELVRKWVAEGSPLGDVGKLPEKIKRTAGWRLPKEPDLVVPMRAKPFEIPADGSVEYQYFVVDPGFETDRWVVAAEVVPGARSAVHHSIVFVRPPDGNSMTGLSWLEAYVPGQKPLTYKPDRARKILAGSKLVFQQHYTPSGTAQQDTTKIGLVFVDESEVKEELITLMAINQQFEIPPHESNAIAKSSLNYFPAGAKLLSISPHMHYRGKSFDCTITRQNGGEGETNKRTVVKVPNYDFNWQHIYELEQAVELDGVESVDVEIRFDNSADNPFNPDPTQYVLWGDQTWEEMAVGFFNVSVPRNLAERVKTKITQQRKSNQRQTVVVTPEIAAQAKQYTETYFEKFDTNQDQQLVWEELPLAGRQHVWEFDSDKNRMLTFEEFERTVQVRLARKLRTRK